MNSPFWEPLNAAINSHPKGHQFSIYFFLSCPSLDRSYQALPVIEAQKRAGGNPHLKMNLFLLSFRFPSTSNPSAVPVYSASGEPEPGTGYEATSPSLNWDSHRSVKARSHLHINPHLLPLTPMLHSIHLSHHQRRICAQASDAFRTCKGNQS